MSFTNTQRHVFGLRTPYDFEALETPEAILELIRKAERGLEASAEETPEGIYWVDTYQDDPNLSFYSGSAGILYLYAKLHRAFGGYEAVLEKATRYLLANWRDFRQGRLLADLFDGTNSFYFGLVGVSLALIEVYDLVDAELQARLKAEVAALADEVMARAKRDEGGDFYWNAGAIGLDGGVILQLLEIEKFTGHPGIRGFVESAARHYLKGGTETKDGLLFDGWGGSFPFVLPNFEFGNAGAGFVLLKLYEYFGDEVYLKTALRAEEFLDAIKIPQERGFLIPYRYGDSEAPIFYLGSCHGPAGTSKFYYKLHQITGEGKYLEKIYGLVDGQLSLGAPLRQSAGLWNSVNLCCGHAGLLQFYLGLYQSLKDEKFLKLAREAAGVLAGEREEGEKGAYWTFAFTRIRPEELDNLVGYYVGSAGVISALLQLYLTETNHFEWTRLTDDPFATK